MIEYFTGEKEKINKEITDKLNSIYEKKIIMYIKAIKAIIVNACFAGILSAIIKICLHLCGILSMFSLDTISKLALIICSIQTVIIYINKTLKPTNSDIKNLKKELSVLDFALNKINVEIERQNELVKKLNNDQSKNDEESLAYDSKYKWTTDYIRLDYVDKIHEASSSFWNNVADEEDKIKNQEHNRPRLVKKLIPPKRNN